MNKSIPSGAEVRAKLAPLGHAQVLKLSELSGVPLPTLWNIRSATTKNPGIDTVRKFLPFVSKVRKV